MNLMTEVVTNQVQDNRPRTHHGLVRRDRGWRRPAARRPHHVCWHHVVLCPRQQRILGTFPDPGGPVPPVLFCRRRTNHRGPHLADGVESMHDELAYWLEWGELFWRIFPARYCGPRSDRLELVAAELDYCSLPRRHPGAHTSQYFPVDLCWPDHVRFELADDWHRPTGDAG